MKPQPPSYESGVYTWTADSAVQGQPATVVVSPSVASFSQFDCDSHRGSKDEWHPFSYLKQRVKFPYGSITFCEKIGERYVYQRSDGYLESSRFPNQWVETGASDRIAYNKAIERLYSLIKGSNLNMAASVAEGHQLKGMMGEAGQRVLKAVQGSARIVRDVQKFKQLDGGAMLREVQRTFSKESLRKKGRKVRSSASNAWLEMTYGWNPFLSDVYGLLDWAASVGHHNGLRREEATARDKGHVVQTFLTGQPKCVRTVDKSVRYKIIVEFSVDNPTLFDVTRFTSLNPLLVAWELVPYSFVVDWFINVSGYLQNMEAALLNGLSFRRGLITRTEKAITSSEYFYNDVFPQAGETGRWISGYVYTSSEIRSLQRTILTSFPLPQLPTLNVNLGANRLLSAAALLSQLLPRR